MASDLFSGSVEADFPATQQPVSSDASPQQKQSIDDYLNVSPQQAENIRQTDIGLTQRKIGLDAANDAELRRRDEQNRSRMERLVAAEGATMDDIKPWNADEQSAKYSHNLWEKFGSPGFVISMLASAFTAMPMNSALNAGAAAMNAIDQGDFEAYHRNFDAWKENTKLTLKRIDLEQQQFDDIDHLRARDMSDWKAKAESILSRFNDTRKLILLQNGMNTDFFEALRGQAEARKQLSDSQVEILKNDALLNLFRMKLGDSKDPAKVSQSLIWANEAMTQPKTPEQWAVHNVVMAPDFLEQPWEVQNKRLNDALREVESARFSSRGSPAQKQAAEDLETLKAEIREKHKDDPNWKEADTVKAARTELARASSRSMRSAAAMAAAKYQEENPKASAADTEAFAAHYTSAIARARTLGTRGANIDTAVTDLYKTAKLAADASKKVPRGNWVPLNEIQQAILKGTSSPEMRVFFDANAAVITAYSQAITRSGGTTVHAQTRADELLNTADGPEAYAAGLHQLQLEAQANQAAVRDVEAGKIVGSEDSVETGSSNPLGLNIK